ncbi:hypothetical protein AMJ86_00570 [bacterium SM23_57]|nr:MAG: hypothetical protein AMJ86_00570 [bacterium SM23_57]
MSRFTQVLLNSGIVKVMVSEVSKIQEKYIRKIFGCGVLLAVLFIHSYSLAGTLSDVTVYPGISSTAGEYTDYVLKFRTSAAGGNGYVGIPKDGGKIKIDFPPGFNCDYTIIGTFIDTLNQKGGLRPEWHQDLTVVLVRDSTGADIPGDSLIVVRFGNVLTTNTPGNYSISIQTRHGNNTIIDNGTGSFQITAAGGFHHFKIQGTPVTATAGENFGAGNITVSARDLNDNVVTDFKGLVYFTSSDPGATLPFTSASPYRFTTGDAGSHNFLHSGFILTKKGSQTISVTNDSLSRTDDSQGILVNGGTIFNFSFSVGTSQTAGVPFSLSVNNAVDAYGNTTSGTIVISDSANAGNSPNGMSPSFNNIFVVDGVGSANQILVNAAFGVQLKGVVGGIRKATPQITVGYGSLGSIKIFKGTTGYTAEFGDSTISIGNTAEMHVEGFDYYGNRRGNESTTWNVSGGIGSVGPPAQNTTFLASNSGTGKVIATYGGGITDETGIITVPDSIYIGPLHHIIIRTGPNNTGQAMSRTVPITLTTDDILTLYAAGYDASNNYIKDTTATWIGIGKLANVVNDTGKILNFNPGDVITTSGNFIRAHPSSGADAFTGDIYVNPGKIHHLVIQDGWVSGSNPIIDKTVKAGNNLSMYAIGYDSDDNYVRPVWARWSVDGNMGWVDPDSSTTVTFHPDTVGFGLVTADTMNGLISGKARITVEPGAPDYIKIVTKPIIYPGEAPSVTTDTVHVTTDMTLRLYAAAFDYFGNFISNAEPQWRASGSLDSIPTSSAAYIDFNPRTATTEGRIHATPPTFKGDSTGWIMVSSGVPKQLEVALGPRGNTQILKDTSLTLSIGDTLFLHATGYDADGNYACDVIADWNMIPKLGTFTIGGDSAIFRANRSGQGYIRVTKAGFTPGLSGTITVEPGDIDYVVIRDAPNGGGNEVGIENITADNTLSLFAAAYDEADNYRGPAHVVWSLKGNLEAIDTTATDTSFKFVPTKAPRTGFIRIYHEATTSYDSTGTITVQPGVPYGNIALTANPASIPADGVSRTYITSDTLYDRNRNQVRQNTLVTVLTTVGTIDTTDLSATMPDVQVAVNANGFIRFPLKANEGGGTANVTATSGNAQGLVTVAISNVKLLSIVVDKNYVSQGQTNIPARMTVQNLGTEAITIESAGLKFTGSGGISRNGEYDVTPPGSYPTIPGSQIRSWDMLVSVHNTASLDTITIDGYITTNIPNIDDNSAFTLDGWRVQKPAEIEILKVDALATQVSQGENNIDVSMIVRNPSGPNGATYKINQVKPTFWDGATDVTDDYVSTLYGSNPSTLAGGDSATIQFKVNVNNGAAERDSILLNGFIDGYDINSERVIKDSTADTTDTWTVLKAARVMISSFKPSHSTITKEQTSSWYVTFVIQNNGYNSVKLDSIDLQFYQLIQNISSEYQTIKPGTFVGSGTNALAAQSEDSLKIEVVKTGTTEGLILLEGYVKLSDLIGKGETIEDDARTHVIVQKPSEVKITNVGFSHPEATRNQALPWQIKVTMRNEGGSDIAIDTTRTNTFVSFLTDSIFTVDYPYFKSDSTTELRFTSQDTLIFNVAKTGNTFGRINIAIQITAKEKNSGRATVLSDTASILIQVEPSITIESVSNEAPNPAGKVNRGQIFPIKAVLKNTGGPHADEVDNIYLRLVSSLQPGMTLTKVLHGVSPLEKKEVFLDVIAADTIGLEEQFSVYIDSARSDNTNEIVDIGPSGLYRVKATLENPSKLTVLDYILPDSVKARQYLPWYIEIVVQDTIGANIVFNKPQPSDIVFMQDKKILTDYQIYAPETLEGGDLILESGQTDRLKYKVVATGNTFGWVKVITNITPVDQNDPSRSYSPELVDSIFVESAANLVIKDALPFCHYVDGVEGQVNINQPFRIGTIIQNGGAERADSIIVKLSTKFISDTAYVEFDRLDTLNFIDIASLDTAFFTITPKKVKRNVTFIVQLLKATGHVSKLPVSLDPTEKNVFIQIHEPAKLTLNLNSVSGNNVFATGQDFQVRATINKTGTASVDNSGKLALIVPAGYQIVTESGSKTTPDTASFIFIGDLAQKIWAVRAPNSISGPDSIRVKFVRIPLDEYAGKAATVTRQYADFPVSIQETALSIISKIIEPEGARDGIVSTYQWFRIQTDVYYSKNLTVKVDLELPYLDLNNRYEIDNNSPVIDSTLHGKRVWTWTVNAPAKQHDRAYFKIITSGFEEGVKKVTKQDSLGIITEKRAELELEVYIFDQLVQPSNPPIYLSTNQIFEITGIVANNGQASVANERAFLYLDISGTNFSFVDDMPRKPFQVDQNVTWKLRAPSTETTLDRIEARIDSIPIDLNRGVSAETDEDKAKVKIKLKTVQHGFVSIDTVKISRPDGAVDGVLSSGQWFHVEADISWHQVRLSPSPSAEILLPPGFFSQFKKQPISSPGTVSWLVQASGDTITGAEIKVRVQAADANDHEFDLTKVSDPPLTVYVVSAASVRLLVEINSPESATDGVVSVGQQFNVKAELTKFGKAEMKGNYMVSIELPTAYNLITSMTQIKNAHESALWTVIAPYVHSLKKEIVVSLVQAPLDANTDSTVHVSQDRDGVSIETEEKSVIITVLQNRSPRAMAKGAVNIPVFGLCFINEGDITSNKLLLKRLQLKLKNRKGELLPDPSRAISRIAAVKASDQLLIYCEKTSVSHQNPIDLVFTRIDTIVPTIPDSVLIMVDIAPDASILDFMFSLDTTNAITIVDMHTNRSPLFKNSSGTELSNIDLNSNYSVIMEADLNQSFCNYPNPFGNSVAPRTKIVYYLKNDADVEIRIFSLIGELVWSQKYTLDEPEGRAGMHDENYFGTGGPPIYWDATNSNGYTVLNGVYIALFSTSEGENATTKIAVIK